MEHMPLRERLLHPSRSNYHFRVNNDSPHMLDIVVRGVDGKYCSRYAMFSTGRSELLNVYEGKHALVTITYTDARGVQCVVCKNQQVEAGGLLRIY
jgi:hypothetical protein